MATGAGVDLMINQTLHQLRFAIASRKERLRSNGVRRGVILLYHRVAEGGADPWRMAVSPENFAAHMAALRRRRLARPLGELAGRLPEPGSPDSGVAVTFDDGYLDNLRTALPILENERVPATIYVVGGAVGKPDAFWWDFVGKVFLETASLPETLTLSHGGATRQWHLGGAARVGPSALARLAGWQADLEPARELRQQVFLDVWAFIAACMPADRDQVIAALADWSGVSPVPSEESGGRPVDPAELKRLAASPLIEIGGHTMTHPDLSQVDNERAADEILGCRRVLQEATGQDVTSFAFPFGRYRRETVSLIDAAGFRNATCSKFGIATGRSSMLELPRVQVPNISGKAFERLLDTLLGKSATVRLPDAAWGRPASRPSGAV